MMMTQFSSNDEINFSYTWDQGGGQGGNRPLKVSKKEKSENMKYFHE